jgi:nitroimidazol reductase NimA-like FMN-containing flavoprotein (pyridoxamine 5'-phosphate oxidase superfamily)
MPVNKTAITILNDYGVMALATVRPDGWPQATCVSYVNDGLLIYFLVSRSSQKFKNISKDDRVSIAIGADRAEPAQIEGLSIAAHAFELRDEPYRSAILKRLSLRHPAYFASVTLDWSASALIRAAPDIISIVDFSQGLGHAETITVGADEMVEMTAERPAKPQSSSDS